MQVSSPEPQRESAPPYRVVENVCQCKRNSDERLVEISEEEARYRQKEGLPVFGHSFDPLQVEYFDRNGFQAWCTEGYRFEAVRYYMISKSADSRE